jgi:hypothetical protein
VSEPAEPDGSVQQLVATDDAAHRFFGAEFAFTIYADKHAAVGEVAGGSWRDAASLLTEHQMVDMAAAREANPRLAQDDKKFRDLLKAGHAFTGNNRSHTPLSAQRTKRL